MGRELPFLEVNSPIARIASCEDCHVALIPPSTSTEDSRDQDLAHYGLPWFEGPLSTPFISPWIYSRELTGIYSTKITYLVFSGFAVTSSLTAQGECIRITGSPSTLASPVSIRRPSDANPTVFQMAAESSFLSHLPFTGCTPAPSALALKNGNGSASLPAFPEQSLIDPTVKYKPKGQV